MPFDYSVCCRIFTDQVDSYEDTFDSFEDWGGRAHRLIVSFTGLAAGAALISLAACSGSTSGTITCPADGGTCTVGVTVTVAWVELVPLTESSNTHVDFATQNVDMDDGNYTGTLAAYDGNHGLVASREVNFYVAGNVAHLANPSAVQQWVNAHVQSGDTIETNNFTIPYSVTNPDATTGQVTATGYVDNQPVTSATSSFSVNGSHRPCKACGPIRQRTEGSGQ